MLKIKIIAMGRLTEACYRDAVAAYAKRMSRSYALSVVEPKVELLPSDPSQGEIDRALAKEAERILAEIPPRAGVVVLAVEGKLLSSEKLAEYLEKEASAGRSELVFVIGSSFGLSPSVKARADLLLSVSPMTFPHELFRVMLYEQLYRAAEITSGSRYHK